MSGWLVLLAGLAGCSSKLKYEEGSNYTYDGELSVTSLPVKPGADLTIDWSGLTTDIRGRPVDPAAVPQVSIIQFPEPIDAILPKLEKNDVAQEDAANISLFENVNGEMSVTLGDFSVGGMALDLALLEPDPDSTWFLSLGRVNYPTDILSSLHLVPTEGSEVTEVAFVDGLATLDAEVDLHSAPRMRVKAGKRYTFNWEKAEKDVFGREFNEQVGNILFIAHYATEDIAEVEANFLQLDTFATEFYQRDVFSYLQADLGEALDEDNRPFEGFTEDGTWLVGITCSECMAPIPLLIQVMDVR